jgi:hypothetical protein
LTVLKIIFFDEGFKEEEDHDQDGMTFLNIIVRFMVGVVYLSVKSYLAAMLMEKLHCI